MEGTGVMVSEVYMIMAFDHFEFQSYIRRDIRETFHTQILLTKFPFQFEHTDFYLNGGS